MVAIERAQVLVNAVCQADRNARGLVVDVPERYKIVLQLIVDDVSLRPYSWQYAYFAEMDDEMVKDDVRELIQQFRDL